MTEEGGDGQQRRVTSLSRWWNDPRWRLGVLIAAVVIVVGIVLAVRYPLEPSDDPTPTPSAAAALPTTAIPRDVPAPADCQVAPRSLAELQALAGPLPATPGSPVAAASATLPPAAVGSADPATIAAINATYRELVACMNAGDFTRRAALLSDDYLRRFFAATQAPADVIVGLLATPQSVPTERWTAIVAMGQVEVRADGRVSALVVEESGQLGPAGGRPRFVFFVAHDGRWLIDDVVDILPAGTPTP